MLLPHVIYVTCNLRESLGLMNVNSSSVLSPGIVSYIIYIPLNICMQKLYEPDDCSVLQQSSNLLQDTQSFINQSRGRKVQ